MAVGDVDRDGDLDVAAAGHLADVLRWWENDPIARTVVFSENLVTEDFADTAVAADVDLDGDLDIVGGGQLRWYERQGSSWQAHDVDLFAGVTGVLQEVAVADIDRDGDPDLAGANLFRVFGWENDGTPLDDVGGGLGTSWTQHEVSNGHTQAQGVSIADIDRDGFLDLVAFDLAADRVWWWQSDSSPGDEMGGDGNSWTERVIDNLTDDPRAALVRDVDRDGDPDVVVVASSFDSKIVIFENHAAQARLTASDVSVTQLPIGTPSAVLELEAISLGRFEDPQVEIGALELLLERSPGDPLDGTEASSVLAALRFYEDVDGSGDFDPGPDLLIAEVLSPSPTAGSLTFTLPDFVNTIGTVSPRTYFLVVETTPDAPAQATDTLRITLRTSRSRMEDTTYDTPLALQSPVDVSTQILLIEDPNLIFSDGFESGDTSGWGRWW